MHAVTFLSAHTERPYSTREIAEMLGVSEAHLSKVLQRLTRTRIVKSVRGPKGGFTIDKSGESVSLLEVYECMEGELPRYDCLLGSRVCSGNGCIFGGLPETVGRQLRDYLEKTKVSELNHLWRRKQGNAQGHHQDR
jgi:Rrf2 family protein